MRVAIIGSGISGLSSAFFLAKKHKVDIFEKNNRLGGHTHTHRIKLDNELDVDSGFIVFNKKNYPNLTKLLRSLARIVRTRLDKENPILSFQTSISRMQRVPPCQYATPVPDRLPMPIYTDCMLSHTHAYTHAQT